uniref:PREDICTED: GapPol polyproteinlike putative n=1 Tax=Albugo laibachii Nc14 TaxID=890382 RepID=F0W3Z2_9STRA|nr:PREDICTED: GapPol polyproteinlike putative [Albugo laibachii Nc14]|eukprot:CCA15787.1 PREDICTED: GapPol polyproteinlike putative [Albugo laibachii Nc14]
MCIVAHLGVARHRGIGATRSALDKSFVWFRMNHDVVELVKMCLHCAATKGPRVTRPLGESLHTEKPNELIHWDYIFMGISSTDDEYILVIKDDALKYVCIMRSQKADAETTYLALMKWFGAFGVCYNWVSDQGTHFKKEMIKSLQHALGAHHHFTTARCPWANGTVEVVNRGMLKCFRALLSDWKMKPREWSRLVQVVQMVLNQVESRSLGGLAPITAMTGLKPMRPLERLALPVPTDIEPITLGNLMQTQRSHWKKLQTDLDVMRKVAARRNKSKREQLERFFTGAPRDQFHFAFYHSSRIIKALLTQEKWRNPPADAVSSVKDDKRTCTDRLCFQAKGNQLLRNSGYQRHHFTVLLHHGRHSKKIKAQARTQRTAPSDELKQAAAFADEVARRVDVEGIKTINSADQTSAFFELLIHTAMTKTGSNTYPLFLVMKTVLSKIVAVDAENRCVRHGFGRRLWTRIDPLQDELDIQVYGIRNACWTDALTWPLGKRFNDVRKVLEHRTREGASRADVALSAVDAVWINPMKDRLRRHWLLHLQGQIAVHRSRPTALTFEMKSSDRAEVARWSSNVWKDILTSMVVSGFAQSKLGVGYAAAVEPDEAIEMQELFDATLSLISETIDCWRFRNKQVTKAFAHLMYKVFSTDVKVVAIPYVAYMDTHRMYIGTAYDMDFRVFVTNYGQTMSLPNYTVTAFETYCVIRQCKVRAFLEGFQNVTPLQYAICLNIIMTYFRTSKITLINSCKFQSVRPSSAVISMVLFKSNRSPIFVVLARARRQPNNIWPLCRWILVLDDAAPLEARAAFEDIISSSSLIMLSQSSSIVSAATRSTSLLRVASSPQEVRHTYKISHRLLKQRCHHYIRCYQRFRRLPFQYLSKEWPRSTFSLHCSSCENHLFPRPFEFHLSCLFQKKVKFFDTKQHTWCSLSGQKVCCFTIGKLLYALNELIHLIVDNLCMAPAVCLCGARHRLPSFVSPLHRLEDVYSIQRLYLRLNIFISYLCGFIKQLVKLTHNVPGLQLLQLNLERLNQPCVLWLEERGWKQVFTSYAQRGLYLDGNFLKNVSGGILLVACVLNGNQQIQIISVVIICIDNEANWSFYLRKLGVILPVKPSFILSDRAKGTFRSVELKNEAWGLAKTTLMAEYTQKAEHLNQMNSAALKCLQDAGVEKLSLAHFPCSRADLAHVLQARTDKEWKSWIETNIQKRRATDMYATNQQTKQYLPFIVKERRQYIYDCLLFYDGSDLNSYMVLLIWACESRPPVYRRDASPDKFLLYLSGYVLRGCLECLQHRPPQRRQRQVLRHNSEKSKNVQLRFISIMQTFFYDTLEDYCCVFLRDMYNIGTVYQLYASCVPLCLKHPMGRRSDLSWYGELYFIWVISFDTKQHMWCSLSVQKRETEGVFLWTNIRIQSQTSATLTSKMNYVNINENAKAYAIYAESYTVVSTMYEWFEGHSQRVLA